jgi:hypothetical protein
MARIMKKRKPNANESGSFFRSSAKRWFNHTESQAKALWRLRNRMVHQYYPGSIRAYPHGFSGAMRYSPSVKIWELNLSGMFGKLRKGGKNCHDYLKGLKLATKYKYAKFIFRYGLFYIT